MTTSKILAWHFLRNDRRLQHSPYTKVEVGQTLEVEPPLRLCSRGLHASVRAMDALRYAPGTILCRVELWSDVAWSLGQDKLCAQYRRVLWMADAEKVIGLWLVEEVEEKFRLERIEDETFSRVLAVRRAFLDGEATRAELNDAKMRMISVPFSDAWTLVWRVASYSAHFCTCWSGRNGERVWRLEEAVKALAPAGYDEVAR